VLSLRSKSEADSILVHLLSRLHVLQCRCLHLPAGLNDRHASIGVVRIRMNPTKAVEAEGASTISFLGEHHEIMDCQFMVSAVIYFSSLAGSVTSLGE